MMLRECTRPWALACAATFATTLILGVYVNKRTPLSESKLQREGQFVGAHELSERFDRIPPAQNAATLYYRACEQIHKFSDLAMTAALPIAGEALLPAPPNLIPGENLKAMEKYVEMNAKTLGLILEATRIHDAQPPPLIPGPDDKSSFYLLAARDAARLLAIDALLKGTHGQPGLAIDHIAAIFRIQDQYVGSGPLINELVRLAIQGIAAQAVQRHLNYAQLRGEDLKSLEEILADREAQNRAALATSLRNELAFVLNAISRDAPPDQFQDMDGGSGFVFNSFSDFNRWLGQDIYERIAAAHLFHALEAAAKVGATQLTSPVGYISNVRSPDLENMAGSMERALMAGPRASVMLSQARLAVAIERYRLANKRLPSALDELVPEYLKAIPKDVLNHGAEIRYSVKGNAYCLASAGMDGKLTCTQDCWAEPDAKKYCDDIIVSVCRPSETK